MKRFLKPSSTAAPSSKKRCILKSLSDELQDIELDSEEKFTIGRSEKTGISDIFCSKEQVLVKPDFNKEALSINIKGLNPSGLNGFMLEQGKGYEAYKDDIIEIVYGRYPYKVQFVGEKPVDHKQNSEQNMATNSNTAHARNEIMKQSGGSEFESIETGKLLVYTSDGVKSSNKIASFDMDGTLIKTKSGRVFPKTIDDWQIAYSEVPGVLKSLHEDGYKIVIFTNQGGISKGRMTTKEFKFKIMSITEKLNVPVQAFIATSDSVYRKPKLGMWNYLEQHKNDGIKIDREKSVYVGDAAGRLEQTSPVKVKKDHSCADRLYAINIGIPFFTPEEYFLKRKPTPWCLPEFNPRENTQMDLLDPKHSKLSSGTLEIIIMVGLPGSGKSFFARQYLQPLGYEVVNRDTLGNAQACISLCEKNISIQKSVVIDNTNVDIETRSRFISIAKSKNITCRCFVMNASSSQMKHNIIFRELTDKSHIKISSMVFNSLKKKFVQPSLSEGFSEIVKVNIIPKFRSVEEEQLYRMYLVED
ncbi:unnamed protein product [Hermetia illucens]|uniref:PNK FHA domain-containing protein n=2 Tax=Hermetia illucens TaxID=343691 RepID=A0A7R8YXG9_HERIL|nr:uncharacterized protein F21D5.5 isoform X1 [Hermetia illucens]CAD7087902.1 unnamed protein product [Hermetia illucens]